MITNVRTSESLGLVAAARRKTNNKLRRRTVSDQLISKCHQYINCTSAAYRTIWVITANCLGKGPLLSKMAAGYRSAIIINRLGPAGPGNINHRNDGLKQDWLPVTKDKERRNSRANITSLLPFRCSVSTRLPPPLPQCCWRLWRKVTDVLNWLFYFPIVLTVLVVFSRGPTIEGEFFSMWLPKKVLTWRGWWMNRRKSEVRLRPKWKINLWHFD